MKLINQRINRTHKAYEDALKDLSSYHRRKNIRVLYWSKNKVNPYILRIDGKLLFFAGDGLWIDFDELNDVSDEDISNAASVQILAKKYKIK